VVVAIILDNSVVIIVITTSTDLTVLWPWYVVTECINLPHIHRTYSTVMRHLMTGICSLGNLVVLMNIIECTYTDLDSV
jgi:hypothetical protein